MKKLVSLVIVMALVLSLAVGAAAQTVGTAAADKGSITISNASKGETYSIYKLFGATVSTATDADGNSQSISYTGEIPAGLEVYFEKDANTGAISARESTLSEAALNALKAWAATVTPTASAESDGSELIFAGLDYGYYVITTTQGNGSAITVTSTRPNATVVDKNESTPATKVTKTVDDNDQSYNIGDIVTYTVTFNTTNFTGAGDAAKKIISYTITDTLPASLDDVTVTSIKLDVDGDLATNDQTTLTTQQFDTNGEITIPWVDADGNSLYANGVTVVLTYTAKIGEDAPVNGAGITNTVGISWTDKEGDVTSGTTSSSNVTISTHAIAIKKVDQSGNPLAGAEFQFPFYVKEAKDIDDAYIYAGTTADAGLTNTLTTGADGLIIVKGLAAGTYKITETEAPAGYNKIDGEINVEATKTTETTTNSTIILDENGNVVSTETSETIKVIVSTDKLAATPTVVLNKTGTELPSTGGMGTTIFYVLGGLMFVGALVLLVTNKRMKAE